MYNNNNILKLLLVYYQCSKFNIILLVIVIGASVSCLLIIAMITLSIFLTLYVLLKKKLNKNGMSVSIAFLLDYNYLDISKSVFVYACVNLYVQVSVMQVKDS